jgi:hypothetical protein
MDPITITIVAAVVALGSGITKTLADIAGRKHGTRTERRKEDKLTIQVDPKNVTPEQIRAIVNILGNREDPDSTKQTAATGGPPTEQRL